MSDLKEYFKTCGWKKEDQMGWRNLMGTIMRDQGVSKGLESIFKEMRTESFIELGKDMTTQVQESQRSDSTQPPIPVHFDTSLPEMQRMSRQKINE